MMKRRRFMSGFGAGLASGLLPYHGVSLAQAKLRQPVTWGGIYQDETANLPNLRAAMQMRDANNKTINGLLVHLIRQMDWSKTNIDLAPLADQASDIETDLGMATVFVAEQDLAAEKVLRIVFFMVLFPFQTHWPSCFPSTKRGVLHP